MKYFGSESLTFFRGLARHNAKPWFEAHREDYEQPTYDNDYPPRDTNAHLFMMLSIGMPDWT